MAMLLTPVVAALEAAMTVVILRWQLALIARRQVARVLRIVRIGAARIVLMRTAFVPIATAVPLAVTRTVTLVVIAGAFGLVHPDAASPIRLCLQARPKAKAQQDQQRSNAHENTSDGVAGFSSSDHNQRPAAETADNRQSCPALGLLRMSPDQRDRLPQLVCPPPLPDNSGPLAPRLSQSATEREQTLDDRTRPDHG